jgi:putative hydrolase of HD superfamily
MKQRETLSSDINFIFEMGNVRLIKRMGNRFLDVFKEDLADHHFRVFWIAMVISAHEGGVDTGKIAKLALLHDIAESRTGDVDYLARQYVERNEKLAIQDMLANSALEKEFYRLWEEYEARETRESQIVKDADNLDVDFELAESEATGHKLPDEWRAAWQDGPRMRLSRFYTESAKQMYQQLQHVSPNGWHMNGRNRINAGDWQVEEDR